MLVGHRLVGDAAYGGGASRVPRGPLFPRQALHASRLALTHPQTGRAVFWKSSLPEDMAALVETLRLEVLSVRGSEAAYDPDDEDAWDDEDQEGGPEVIYINDDEVVDEQ